MGEYTKKEHFPIHTPVVRRGAAREIPTNEILQAYREGTLNRSLMPVSFPANKKPLQAATSRQPPIGAILQRYKEDMYRHVQENRLPYIREGNIPFQPEEFSDDPGKMRRGNEKFAGSASENGAPTTVLQGKLYNEPSSMATLVASQRDLQAKPDAEIAALLGGKPFTTVGFEHEFGQLNDEGSVLHNLTHLELAKSENFGYSGLPFSLETDASDAIELVSPPFIMETNEQGVPATKDVVDADRLMKTGLSGLLTAPVKFSG